MSRNLRVYKQSELASRDTTKSFFGPLGLSLRKNTGGGGWAPRAPPLDPPLINTYGL